MRLGTFVMAAFVGAVAVSGCSHKKDDGTQPVAESTSLPALTIRDDTPDLMLTWVDEKGDTHVEVHPADVPALGRAMVRVIVADREDGTKDVFYIADLTRKDGDGAYLTKTMTRRAWEAELEKRRDAYLAKVAPPPAVPSGQGLAGAPPQGGDKPQATGLTVIIYGAAWCKPCHQAADYLKQKGITVIMKDVEESPGAGAEMREKLERAGRRGGAIPVIDVRGQILVGFDARDLDRAVAKAQTGTVL
jgi:glutaredoxin